MATQVTRMPSEQESGRPSWSWLRELVRWESAPYPGRVNTVARMTITATLVMVVVETFRIPNAFLAGLYAILLARENLAATWRNGRILVTAFVGASLYTLLGMTLFRGSPVTHFFWVIGSLYLAFFVMRTATNYAAALVFAIPVGIALPIWDRPLPSQIQVEGTLWPVLIIALGAGVTVGTEAIYRIFDRSDPFVASVNDLLLAVQQVLESLATQQTPPRPVLNRVLQYQMTGTGRLRLTLLRQGLDPTRRAHRSALISLSGRLIGLASDLERSPPDLKEEDVARLRTLCDRLATIRTQLLESGSVSAHFPVVAGLPSAGLPVLPEMEQTVVLITEVFQTDQSSDDSQNSREPNWWRALFLPDAFQNPEYRRFALAGCLASSACYVLYNALDWPGIGTTCVLTCVVTALTTIGNSVQAQSLRLAGFVIGGVVMGLSAQMWILPGIDSVFGFALLFATATAIAAWFATSSPRLSYFGLQIALAFYFVNLQDTHFVTDLTIVRDKVIGVLVGILAMGLIFDRFGTKSDADQLQKLLVRNVTLLAEFGACLADAGRAGAASQIRRLRSQINDNFASLESQTDAARFEFEFRHRREGDIAECGRIQRVQPWLRSIYLLELALFSHRVRRDVDSELTQVHNNTLRQFLNEYSDKLMHIAAWITNREDAPAPVGDDSVRLIQQVFGSHASANARVIDDICEKMVSSFLMLRSGC